MRIIIYATILVICLAFTFFFIEHENDKKRNLAGICEEKGRALTEAEKKEIISQKFRFDLIKIREFGDEIKSDIENGLRPKQNFSNTKFPLNHNFVLSYREQYDDDFLFEYFELPTTDDFKSNISVFVYPDVPKYAKKNGRYADYKYGTLWEPVSEETKSDGYAFDLVFVELNLIIKPQNSPEFPLTIDERQWVNACAVPVQIPETLRIG